MPAFYWRSARLLVLSLLLVSCAPFSRTGASFARLDGSTISSADVDRTVERLMAAAEVPGLALALFNDGRVVYSRGYGFRNADERLPMTDTTVFGAASFTKVAFAYFVMRLVDAGVLDLDQPLETYLPQSLPSYPRWADLAEDARYKKLTARILLSQTSGLANFRTLEPDRKLRIHFEPGSRYAYSGEGLQLLQFVIETKTQRSLQEWMNTEVFQPLGMQRTSMVTEARVADDLASGHDNWNRNIGAQNRRTADAAGSMQTSVRDFTKLMSAVLKGQGLSPSARKTMLGSQIRITSAHQFPTLSDETTTDNDAIRLSYGLGWGLYWTPRGKAWFKEGNDNGFRHYCVTFEDSGHAMVIMTNSANGEGIYKELLEVVLGNPYTPIEWERFAPWSELPARGPAPALRPYR